VRIATAIWWTGIRFTLRINVPLVRIAGHGEAGSKAVAINARGKSSGYWGS
jgi:hypothetical protein